MTASNFIRLLAGVWLALSALGYVFFKGDGWFGLQVGLALAVAAEPLGSLLGGTLKHLLNQLPKTP